MKGTTGGILPSLFLLVAVGLPAQVTPYEVRYGGAEDVDILTSDDLGEGYDIGTPPDPWEIMRKIVAEELSKMKPALAEQLDQKLAILSKDIKLEILNLRSMLKSQKEKAANTSPAIITPEVAVAELNVMTDSLKKYIAEHMSRLRSEFESSFKELGESMEDIAQKQSARVEKALEKRTQEVTDALRKVFHFTRNQVTILQEQLGNLTERLGDPDEDYEGDLQTVLKKITLPPGLIQNLVKDPTTTTTTAPVVLPRDCMEVLEQGKTTSGVYRIQIDDLPPQDVYCDQKTEGGGWTVMVARKPTTEEHLSFRQDWRTYENGFGDAENEYWIGLKALNALTSRSNHELRADMRWRDERAFSHYGEFSVGSRVSNYRLHVADFDEASTGGDSMTYHDEMEFTTYDRDNDRANGGSCSSWSGDGGWWFNFCFYSNPTGIYPPADLDPEAKVDHILEWRKWQGYYTYLDELYIKIRPKK